MRASQPKILFIYIAYRIEEEHRVPPFGGDHLPTRCFFSNLSGSRIATSLSDQPHLLLTMVFFRFFAHFPDGNSFCFYTLSFIKSLTTFLISFIYRSICKQMVISHFSIFAARFAPPVQLLPDSYTRGGFLHPIRHVDFSCLYSSQPPRDIPHNLIVSFVISDALDSPNHFR